MSPPSTPVVDAMDVTAWGTASGLLALVLVVVVMAGLGLHSSRPTPSEQSLPAPAPAADTVPPPEQASDPA